MVPRELIARETRRRRIRDAEAILALALWGARRLPALSRLGGERDLPEPLNDLVGTAVYLVTFFYLFAIWPILSGLDRLFRGFAPSVAPAPEPRLRTAAARSAPPPRRWSHRATRPAARARPATGW